MNRPTNARHLLTAAVVLSALNTFAVAAQSRDPQSPDPKSRQTRETQRRADWSTVVPRDWHTAVNLLRNNNFTLRDAIKKAEEHCDGQAVSASCRLSPRPESGREEPTGGMVEVAVVDKNNQLKLVSVDVASKEVTAVRDWSMDDDSMFTRIFKAKEIMGKNVKNSRGETLGEIEDLAIDMPHGRVAYAVLSTGGAAGLNKKLYAIPWGALTMSHEGTVTLEADKARLESAPVFTDKSWPKLVLVEYARSLHVYYNQRPYWEEVVDAKIEMIDKASETIGRKVTNAKDENLGRIEDLAIEPETGHVKYAVLSFGGILGIGDKYFAIPWDALIHTSDGKCLLNVEKERLKSAPGFDKDNWPDMANPEFGRSIREYYAKPQR